MADYGIGSITLNSTTWKVTAHNVQGALGGILELWQEPAVFPVETKQIETSDFTWEFAHQVNQSNCYYVISKEAVPSPNFDMMYVPGLICGGPVDTQIESQLASSYRVKVNMNLENNRYDDRETQIRILSRIESTDSFVINSTNADFERNPRIENNGRISEIDIELESRHKSTVVFVVIPPQDTDQGLRFCRLASAK